MAATAGEQSRWRSSKRSEWSGRCSSSSRSSYSSSCSRSCSRSTSSDDASQFNRSCELEDRKVAAAPVGSLALRQRQLQERQQHSGRQGFGERSLSGGITPLTGVSAAANFRPTAAATPAAETRGITSASARSARATPGATVAASPAAAAVPQTAVKLSSLLQRMQQLQQKHLKLLRLRQQRLSLEQQLEAQLTAAVAAQSSNRHTTNSSRRPKQAAAPAVSVNDCDYLRADRKVVSSPLAAGDAVAGLGELLTVPSAPDKRSRSSCRSSSSSRSRSGSDLSQDSRCSRSATSSSGSSKGSSESLRKSSGHPQESLHHPASGAAADRRRCSESSSTRRTKCKLVARLTSLCCSLKKQLHQQGRCRDSLLLRFRSSKQRMAAAAAELQQQQQGVYCLRVLKLHEVVQLLPIENSESGRSILSLPLAPLPELIGSLKDSKVRAEKALTVSAAVGFCVLLLLLISCCTDTPLQQRLLARGSRSAVCTLQGEELPLYLREGATATELQQLQHGLVVLLQTVEGLACDRGHAAKPAAEGDLLQRIEALLHNEMWGFEAAL
ncbi:hypothetical protein Emed_005823 [Eimeria media]